MVRYYAINSSDYNPIMSDKTFIEKAEETGLVWENPKGFQDWINNVNNELYEIRIIETKDSLEVKQGDKFLCTTRVKMEDGEIAYRRGKIYISEKDTCITDDQGDKSHFWTNDSIDSDWTIYFKRL